MRMLLFLQLYRSSLAMMEQVCDNLIRCGCFSTNCLQTGAAAGWFLHLCGCMKRQLQLTADGSHTIAIPEGNLTYHSIHGAVRESRHVFIEAGLRYVLSRFSFSTKESLRIFEMGFGTGLNALLSLEETGKTSRSVYYEAAELYPLSAEEAKPMNYPSQLGNVALAIPFMAMHQCAPNEPVAITPFFTLHKSTVSLLEITMTEVFHLIYFDAFAPAVQPELWTTDVFQKMYNRLYEGGTLVTYCSKGEVRRAMQSAGFAVEKLKGPPGKREMLRAVKR